jgi:hypothetical protein
MCLLLDLVEVAKSHSGLNLASAFAKILKDFGIEHKVSFGDYLYKTRDLLLWPDPRCYMRQRIAERRDD